MSSRWYVIQSKPRQERRALDNLQRQGFEVCLPLIEAERIHAQQVVKQLEPLFSRYLFLRASDSIQSFRTIRSTLGVSRLVSFGERPATVADELVSVFRAGPRAVERPLFRTGQRVQLLRGPLSGVEAVFLEPNGEARAMVLIELIGRPHTIPTDLGNLLPLTT